MTLQACSEALKIMAYRPQLRAKDVLAVALNVASLVQTGPHFKVTKADTQGVLGSSHFESQACSRFAVRACWRLHPARKA